MDIDRLITNTPHGPSETQPLFDRTGYRSGPSGHTPLRERPGTEFLPLRASLRSEIDLPILRSSVATGWEHRQRFVEEIATTGSRADSWPFDAVTCWATLSRISLAR